jgi:hypothetical protein
MLAGVHKRIYHLVSGVWLLFFKTLTYVLAGKFPAENNSVQQMA